MPSLRRKLPSANALFVFEAAARCGNFTRAAQELYVSQPAVSRKISEGLNGIEDAIREIESRATGIEPVTLSISTAFTTHWLMPRMSRLNQAFPSVDLRFQLISGRIGGPLGDVDLGMRFVQEGEMRENSVPVMPEVLLPVCNARYQELARTDARRAHGDMVIVMDDEERGWHARFAAFQKETRHVAGVLSFNDYAIVVQAALLGQGIALGWVNVVMHWLAQRALVPTEDELLVTNRMCCLSWAPGRPLRPIVAEVRDWLIAEMHADLDAVDTAYPALGLGAAVKKGLASWS